MKLVKRFFKTKILLWKVVGIGLIALLGLVLGLYISFSKANSESNQTTNTYSTIKKNWKSSRSGFVKCWYTES